MRMNFGDWVAERRSPVQGWSAVYGIASDRKEG